jgi:hypothetical protein
VEAFDFKIAKMETRAGFEDFPRDRMIGLGLHGAGGRGIGEDLDVGEFFKSIDPGGMIAVFVGEKDRVDFLQCFAGFVKQLAEFALGEARIDQDAGAFGAQHGAIARAAAAEDFKAHSHVSAAHEEPAAAACKVDLHRAACALRKRLPVN